MQTGNFDKWTEGPSLPEPRADASVVFVAGSIYVIGGRDASGAPTKTVFVLSPDRQTGALGEWTTADYARPARSPQRRGRGDHPGRPAARRRPERDGPVATTFKTLLNSTGALGAWSQEQSLNTPQADATAVLVGDYLWLYGGSDAQRPDRGGPARGVR